jgi:hypothetical protein
MAFIKRSSVKLVKAEVQSAKTEEEQERSPNEKPKCADGKCDLKQKPASKKAPRPNE